MNLRRSSMRLHSFQGTFALPQKARLCNPCVRNEVSPLSQEGQYRNGRGNALRARSVLVRVEPGTPDFVGCSRFIGGTDPTPASTPWLLFKPNPIHEIRLNDPKNINRLAIPHRYQTNS